ncbi:MAG: hypothetical protein KY459_06875 [Acidobacteria bacterium]|nr:hypothetical protein [Acidobacteriota bacterium]
MNESHPNDVDLMEAFWLDEATYDEHLESCEECSARFAALRLSAAGDAESVSARAASKPDAFWERQRTEINARLLSGSRPGTRSAFVRGFAIALVLVMSLATGALLLRPADTIDASGTATTKPPAEANLFEEDLQLYDPWGSENIQAFHQVVDWEDWLTDEQVEAGENGS